MIEIQYGDLLANVKSGYILHGCNDQGVMGAGFARQLKNTYPSVFRAYHHAYKQGKTNLGQVIASEVSDEENSQKLVVFNAITQHLWKGHPTASPERKRFVSYDAVAESCEAINAYLDTQDEYVTVHFPMIGAGLGGGNWKIIESIIDETIRNHTKVLWKIG